jgi:hypothetical protein
MVKMNYPFKYQLCFLAFSKQIYYLNRKRYFQTKKWGLCISYWMRDLLLLCNVFLKKEEFILNAKLILISENCKNKNKTFIGINSLNAELEK